MKTQEALHPIGYVARRTGLTTHVIRIWESRYRAIEPTRTDTNRRLYSDQDIERLRLLKEATALGHTISRIAQLSDDSLTSMIRRDQSKGIDPWPHAKEQVSPEIDAETYLQRCKDAVPGMDRNELESIFRDAISSLSAPFFFEELVAPFMRWIGDEWHEGRIRVSHEHFASVVVRDVLYRFGTQSGESQLPAIVICTPAGNQHEIGALLAAGAAALDGWRVIYLGANLPVHEIVGAVVDQRAFAVGLSATYTDDSGRLVSELQELQRSLPSNFPVFIGGGAAAQRWEELEKLGIQFVENLQAFRNGLRDSLESSQST
jgi:methanogenic corrinoid protein MtbC1